MPGLVSPDVPSVWMLPWASIEVPRICMCVRVCVRLGLIDAGAADASEPVYLERVPFGTGTSNV